MNVLTDVMTPCNDSHMNADKDAPEYVRSADGLVWRVTQKHYVRGARKPYLLDVVGAESGLPNAFDPDEVTPIPPGASDR